MVVQQNAVETVLLPLVMLGLGWILGMGQSQRWG